MAKKSGVTFYTFFLLIFFVQSAYASNIAQIAVGSENIPFLLDDTGQVWAFRKPLTFEEPIKLPNLDRIKKIEPFIALDVNGQVYTWSLNKAGTEFGEEGILKAAYTTPNRVANLKGVTIVAYTGSHYIAVIENSEIVAWEMLRKKGTIFVTDFSPLKKIISRKGVKAVAGISNEEIISVKRVVLEPSTLSLVALYEDGTVMGWGINSSGAATRNSDTVGVVLTHSPGATNVDINSRHTVVFAADGIPRFGGGVMLTARIQMDDHGRLVV